MRFFSDLTCQTDIPENGDPYGIRTRVAGVKGRCPRPLDERVIKACH